MASLSEAVFDIVDTATHYWRVDREVYQARRDHWAEQLVKFIGQSSCLELLKDTVRHENDLVAEQKEIAYNRLPDISLGLSVLHALIHRNGPVFSQPLP